MKLKKCLSAFSVYLFLLLAFYIIHIKFFSVNVVFYSAIYDGLLASLVTTVILFKVRYFGLFNPFEKLQMVVIWVLVGYVFAISVPAVIDRSLSFYILEKLQQRGNGIKQDRIKDVFTDEYLYEYRLVDVRLTEQLESGTIIIKDGCVLLTKRGELLASFGGYFRKNLLPKKRLLMGEYTDDLTDPFRNSQDMVDYKCQ